MENTKTTNKPTHRIYQVQRNTDGKSNWIPLGAAWPQKDGKGFNLKFDSLPFVMENIAIRVIEDTRPTQS